MKLWVAPRLRHRRDDLRGRRVAGFLGLGTVWRGGYRIKWRKCPACTGGVQWLSSETGLWGPVPYAIRREKKDEVGSPLANIRDCDVCHGIGKGWTVKDETPDILQ